MEKKKLALIPYGDADFTAIRTEGYAYVDKTQFIEVLENTGLKYPLIIRPRRFGKSLFTAMLYAYYDIKQAYKFNENFAGTYISEHKTPLANSFYILKFDFSGLATDDVKENFTANIKSSFCDFIERYNLKTAYYLIQKDFTSPTLLIDEFFRAIKNHIEKKIYIIIDEYDQFANEILSKDKEQFRSITSAQGFLKDFYTTLKTYTAIRKPIARIFITGVTTISMDSMSSGFNIQVNISQYEDCATMFGFTETELKQLIPQVIDLEKYGHTVDEVFNRMKTLYNGYHFTKFSDKSVFNSSMCLYYLNEIRVNNREPDNLLDPAFAQDLSKIHSILSMGDINTVKEIINDALSEKQITFNSTPSTINLNSQERFSKKDLLSTMMFFGYLTWKKNSNSLIIPNRTVAEQFFEYYFKYLRGIDTLNIDTSEFMNAFINLRQGSPEEFVKAVTIKLREAGCLHLGASLHESDFAVALATAANFSPDFNVHLELEVTGKEKGYADLVLSPLDGVNCSYIFELKYLPVSKGSDEAVKEKLNEANAQLDRYCQGDNIAKLPSLKRVACVFVGTEVAHIEVC